jgi:hypothetical protein
VPPQKSNKPNEGVWPATMHAPSFSEDDGGGVPDKPQEAPQQITKPKSGIQPATIRGASFGKDNSDGIPEKPHEPYMQPSTMRESSFGDAAASLRSLMSPRKIPADQKGAYGRRPKRGMGPSTMRGASVGDNDGRSIPEKPNTPLILREASFGGGDDASGIPPEFPNEPCMRTPTTHGAAIGDDDGVPDEPHEPPDNSIKQRRILWPSTKRGTSFADAVASLRNLMSPRKPFSELRSVKPKRGMRQSKLRRSSFSDVGDNDDTGGVPEEPRDPTHDATKPHEHGMPSSMMRRASFGDGDVTPRSPVERVENEPVTPAPIRSEKERYESTDYFKNQVKPAKIPNDDNGKEIEGTPNHHKPGDTHTTETSVEGKSRLTQSTLTEKKKADNLEKRRRRNECYKWYAWMGQPTRAVMKSRVPHMPDSCGITVADVEELPWMTGGKVVNVIEMNKMILGEN